MGIKPHLIRILFCIIPITLTQSCATNQLEVTADSDAAETQEHLVRILIDAAYHQDLETLQNKGVDLRRISRYLTSDYSQCLANLIEVYQTKMSQFSEFDKTVLERLFTSEINFALLRPWSYQPEKQSVSVVGTTISSGSKEVVFSYVETRWKDQCTAHATASIRTEKSKLRIENIIWKDTRDDQDVWRNLDAITKALRDSKDMTDFESHASHLY